MATLAPVRKETNKVWAKYDVNLKSLKCLAYLPVLPENR
jgi:hypothetical protein